MPEVRESSASRYDLLDSVKRDIAREKRAFRQVQRLSDGEISIEELQGSLTPAPPRRRISRAPSSPPVDESRSAAAFIAMSATAMLLVTVLALGFLGLFSIAGQILIF